MRSSDFVLALPLVAALPHFPSTNSLMKRFQMTQGTATGLTDAASQAKNAPTVAQSKSILVNPVHGKSFVVDLGSLASEHEDDHQLNGPSNLKTIKVVSGNSIIDETQGDQTSNTPQEPSNLKTIKAVSGNSINDEAQGDQTSNTPQETGQHQQLAAGNQEFSSADPTPEKFKKPVAQLNKYRVHHNHTGKVPVVAWNNKLAESAQEWANNCQSTNHSTPDGVGQNIYSTTANLGDLGTEAMDVWSKEQSIYAARTKYAEPSAFDHAWGHYTAMVWAGTTRVGCARNSVQCGAGHIIVCDFWIAGNMLGSFESNVFKPSIGGQAFAS